MDYRNKHAFQTALRAADVGEVRRRARRLRNIQEPWSPEDVDSLFYAAIDGGEAAPALLECLLEAGFDPNHQNANHPENFRTTPLAKVVRAGRIDLAERLVSAGADIHWRTPLGGTLMSFCWPSRSWSHSHPDTPEARKMCAWLAARGVTLDVKSDASRWLLHCAANRPQSWPEIFQYLAMGFDADVLDWPPFMMDIAAGRLTAEQAGALSTEQLDHRDGHRRTAFLLAVLGGQLPVAQAIVEKHPHRLHESPDRPADRSALHLAARENEPTMLEWLVQQGLEVDLCHEPGETPLRTAVEEGNLEAAQMLLRLGANPNLPHEFGPMIHEAERFDVMKLLVEHGADVNDLRYGEWPLKSACERGVAEHVRWLLEHGAHLKDPFDSETELFMAVASGSIPCVDLILQAGARINAQDSDGWTCLFHANSVEMADFLLAHGADPSIADQCDGIPERWRGLPLAVRIRLRAARHARKNARPNP